MSVVINSNAAATSAANNLASSNAMLQKSLNRLSSGSKIVNPADDAGGLAVSMKLSAAARRSGAANTNIQNATSFLQTQDGAMKVTAKVLERISELRVLYSDPTKNDDDKANYDAEFTELQAQLVALTEEEFNGIALFGSDTEKLIPVTESGNSTVELRARDLSSLTDGVGALMLAPDETDYKAAGKTALETLAQSWVDADPADRPAIAEAYNEKVDELFGESGTEHDALAEIMDNMVATPADAEDEVDGLGAIFDDNEDGVIVPDAPTSLGDIELSDVNVALQNLATMRAQNGAEQSRLGFAAEVLTVNKANLEAANSRIVDVDVAEESTQLARWNTLVQAGTAMLSQANQSSQTALQLLQ